MCIIKTEKYIYLSRDRVRFAGGERTVCGHHAQGLEKLSGKSIILGGGVTGLAAGIATGWPVFEAEKEPGGICGSYYIRPGFGQRLITAPEDGEAYRFEKGGGHWIFGANPEILAFIRQFVCLKKYNRRAAVFFSKSHQYVPYPLQNNLRFLDETVADQAIKEMSHSVHGSCETMASWLESFFGSTLNQLFFAPFHERYTAGLYGQIAPQDPEKSPVDLKAVKLGAKTKPSAAGYNKFFVYPKDGLDVLLRKMAKKCDIRYEKCAVKIDVNRKEIYFSDHSIAQYDSLISTLPLNRMIEMTGLSVREEPFPYTSVLVLNIGAKRGAKCPEDHWLYIPDSESGFFRVGFYSNVDKFFLPKSLRNSNRYVNLYVERAFLGGGMRPSEKILEDYEKKVIKELQDWGFIGEVEVLDPTWIDVAYTWAWPSSLWKDNALAELRRHKIHQVGRYARWGFQGIADSIKEGLCLSEC